MYVFDLALPNAHDVILLERVKVKLLDYDPNFDFSFYKAT